MDFETKLERLSFVVRCVGRLWAAFFAVLAIWVGVKVPHDQRPLLLFALTGAAGYGIGLTLAWGLSAVAAKMEERVWLEDVALHELDGETNPPDAGGPVPGGVLTESGAARD